MFKIFTILPLTLLIVNNSAGLYGQGIRWSAAPGKAPMHELSQSTVSATGVRRGATAMFPGGSAVIRFRPFHGGWRAMLVFTCSAEPCGHPTDVALTLPLAGGPPIRVGFRWIDDHFMSMRRLNYLPNGTMLSFVMAGQHRTIRIR